jgi:hypothetical protein
MEMEEDEVRNRLDLALRRLVEADRHLLENDLSERCLATRLAMYLQDLLPGQHVDVEYNRAGARPKRLNLPEDCANYWDDNGEALVVPDVIVHRRGAVGPNLLVIEMKKTSNRESRDCDRMRIRAFRDQLGYTFGALVECETRRNVEPAADIAEWVAD